MAQERGTEWEKVSCPICLDPLKDPVTVPCGHSYCMDCVKTQLNEEDNQGTPKCPQCCKTLIPRSGLKKNIMLAELEEEMKKAEEAAPADHCYAGPEDVACDVCTGRKLKSSKFCLVCLVSYCEKHLQPHYESPAFEKHKLINPSNGLKQYICSCHNELMKIFCRTDQQCICIVCSLNDHKGHDTVSVEVERRDRENDVQIGLEKVQQSVRMREEDVKLLQEEAEAIVESADNAMKDSDAAIAELVSFIEGKGSGLIRQVKSQKKTEVNRVKALQNKVKREIAELKRKDAELKQLSHTEDHVEFLLSFSQRPKLSESADEPTIKMNPTRHFEDVPSAVSEMRDKCKDLLSEEWKKISLSVSLVDVLLPQEEPKTREEFLKYSRQLTLEPANMFLLISNQNRKVSENPRSSYADRCFSAQHVLSQESLSGPSYWEVEWSGKGVSVGVSYKNAPTEWYPSRFGSNSYSWALDCYKSSYEFRHNNVKAPVSGPPSSRVGVYLDNKAGILSFHSISDTMALLHRVQTTFTQPLYAGIWVWGSYWANTTATFNEIK